MTCGNCSVELFLGLKDFACRRFNIILVVVNTRFKFDFIDHDTVFAIKFTFEIAHRIARKSGMGKSDGNCRFFANVLPIARLHTALRVTT